MFFYKNYRRKNVYQTQINYIVQMCSHLIRHKYTNFESRIHKFVYLCIYDLRFVFLGLLHYNIPVELVIVRK